MIDSTEFTKKPTVAQEEAMNMEQANLTIKELIAAVEKGQCFNPCLLDKDNKFVSSSLVAIEVNNDALKQKKYGKISVQEFLEDALKSKVKPVLVYKALNTTKKFDRFVAVFELDKEITDLSLYIDTAYKIKKRYLYADVVPTAMVYGAKEIVYVENIEAVAPETTGIRLATPEDIKTTVQDEVVTSTSGKKLKLATPEDLKKIVEDEEWAKNEIAAYDAEEEEWIRLELEDHDRMCKELDMLENMTEEEKDAYYEKKFAEEDAKAAAEIEAQKKAAEERGYSFVGTVENGKKVWRYQLEANFFS